MVAFSAWQSPPLVSIPTRILPPFFSVFAFSDFSLSNFSFSAISDSSYRLRMHLKTPHTCQKYTTDSTISQGSPNKKRRLCRLSLSNQKQAAHPALNGSHERYRGSQLGDGDPASPVRICLVLLHSCPDTVHKGTPRRGPRVYAAYRGLLHSSARPRRDITPAMADCRCREPPSPRLCGLSVYESAVRFVKRTAQKHVAQKYSFSRQNRA